MNSPIEKKNIENCFHEDFSSQLSLLYIFKFSTMNFQKHIVVYSENTDTDKYLTISISTYWLLIRSKSKVTASAEQMLVQKL